MVNPVPTELVQIPPETTFSVESANLKKPDAEHGGDKVWANFNGSATLFDGMGGYGGDYLAARVGGYALNRQLEALPKACLISDAVTAIRQGYVDAGLAIREGRKKGKEFEEMDAVGDGNKICQSADGKRHFLVVGHVGDTRTTIFRAQTGILEQVTTDHTLVQRLVDSKQIDKGSAFLHPQRNIVYRNIADINPENVNSKVEFEVVELNPGDFAVISSDGLGDNIELSTMQKIIQESPQALEKIQKGGWPSGLAMHLAETAYGIMKRNAEPQAKPDDVSVAIIALHQN